MQEFDSPEGTWPSPKGIRRLVRRAGRMVAKCEKLLGKQKSAIRLMDVGCSSGALVYAAQSVGVKAEGVEPSLNPVKTAKSYGLKVHQGFVEDLKLTAESYDVVTLFEVVEHLKDPLQLFKECYRVLSPDGIVIVKTGNTHSLAARMMRNRWEYFDMTLHGGHISFFNPCSLELLADRSGFKVDWILTRKVNFYEKNMLPYALYRMSRFFANILRHPVAWLGKGHEMMAYLQKLPQSKLH
ncbi:MAG: class I SAM-dependent methyltransferase [Desulfobacterales bacterium]|nr:MAG: class I SAM-dependent methyltransferase [Desulfobacterales bacterium]